MRKKGEKPAPRTYWRLYGGAVHCFRPVRGKKATERWDAMCGRAAIPGDQYIIGTSRGLVSTCERPPEAMRCPGCEAMEAELFGAFKRPVHCKVAYRPVKVG
jgi:hypothetical protein